MAPEAAWGAHATRRLRSVARWGRGPATSARPHDFGGASPSSPRPTAGKASKKGQLKLVKDGASYKTLTEGQGDAKDDLLVTVFENGVLMKDWSKLEVSANAAVINKKGIVAGSVLPG